MAMGIGAIENALLDAKAKLLGVPCCDLLGGRVRDRIRVYWSHCGTWRIAHPGMHGPVVSGLDDIRALGAEVREAGFTALKTNIFDYRGERVTGWAPGFGRPFQPDQNVERHVIRQLRAHLEAFRDGAGPDVDILVDLNYNARPEGYLRILRALADLDIFWFEIDSPHPEATGGRTARQPACNRLVRVDHHPDRVSAVSSGGRRWTWRSSTRYGTAPGSR